VHGCACASWRRHEHPFESSPPPAVAVTCHFPRALLGFSAIANRCNSAAWRGVCDCDTALQGGMTALLLLLLS
jgi:hypothetical protein